MADFVVSPKEIEKAIRQRFAPDDDKIRSIAFFLLQQVKARFRNQGAPGEPWKPKRIKEWGADDGRKILTGPSGALLMSFRTATTKDSAMVYSELRYAPVHQLGTVGAGGILPDIVPKKAKALFIPITDRAAHSQRLSGKDATVFRRGGKPVRVAVKYTFGKGRKQPATSAKFLSLIPGRLHEGRLQRQTSDGEYVDGIPDFIFLRRARIPPRPMLPDSKEEQDAQLAFITRTLAGK